MLELLRRTTLISKTQLQMGVEEGMLCTTAESPLIWPQKEGLKGLRHTQRMLEAQQNARCSPVHQLEGKQRL